MRPQRGGRESGAATLELTGVTIIAAVLVVALLTAVMPQARIMGETYSYWICKVVTFGQGSCTPPSTSPEAHQPTEPCVLTANGVERNEKISVIVFTASDGRRIEVARLSNGEYRLIVTDTGGAGLETGVGGGLSITVNDRTVGGTAAASAGVSLDLKAGQVYYTDADGLPARPWHRPRHSCSRGLGQSQPDLVPTRYLEHQAVNRSWHHFDTSA